MPWKYVHSTWSHRVSLKHYSSLAVYPNSWLLRRLLRGQAIVRLPKYVSCDAWETQVCTRVDENAKKERP